MEVDNGPEADGHDQQAAPNPELRCLEVMVGTWELKGREFETGAAIHGRVTLEWMEGGFYLVQRVETDYAGKRITGTEYVGYNDADQNLRSYFFSNDGPGPFGGVALEYVWELDDDEITIWGGFVGSPASWRARFSDDRNTIQGRWEWPGGGYEATMTRVSDQ